MGLDVRLEQRLLGLDLRHAVAGSDVSLPVVRVDFWLADHVAVHECPHPAVRVAGVGLEQCEDLRRRAAQVEVVHEVQLANPAVSRAVAPVVDHVVADVEPAGELLPGPVQPAREAPVPPGAVGEQVVVEAADVPRDASGERVSLAGPLVLLVAGEVQGLRNDAALDGEVPPFARAEALVDAPTDRAVVEDDVLAAAGTAPVLSDARLVSETDA